MYVQKQGVTLNIPACIGYLRQMFYLRNWLNDDVLKSTYFSHHYKKNVHDSICYTSGETQRRRMVGDIKLKQLIMKLKT